MFRLTVVEGAMHARAMFEFNDKRRVAMHWRIRLWVRQAGSVARVGF